MKHPLWKLNTSNPGKSQEFKLLFAKYGHSLEISSLDLPEIEADPISVVTHKASQMGENILVEDTSLEIEDSSIGIHVRWLLDHLSKYVGRQAHWTALLAYRNGGEVLIFKGEVLGTIVEPKGIGGYGFDRVFLPDGASETLAKSKPDQFNARTKAVEALMKGNIWMTRPVIEQWEGKWQ